MAYGFRDAERRLVASYAEETRDGCASTGPSFAGGRNLVTFTVELLESKSPVSYASGVRFLDALLRRQVDDNPRRREILLGQHALVKHLLLAEAGHVIIQRLLHTLDPRSPYDRETRGCAAKIVAYIAGGISLERFPGGMQCIASLLGTFQEYSSMEPLQRDWLLEAHEPECLHEAYDQVSSDALFLELTKRSDVPVDCDDDMGYRDLVLQGMRILHKLAADEDNCKIISNTPGLLSKIMAPLTSDLLHNSSHAHAHAKWPSDVVEGSLRVMLQLATPSGEAGTNLRRAISADRQAVTTMHNILRCHKCQAKEYCLAALKILTQLCLDDESCHLGIESKEDFIKILLHKFVIDDEDNSIRPPTRPPTRQLKQQGSIRKLAGEALEMLSDRSECNAATILKANDTVVDELSKILLDGQSTTYRKSAAQILENLCRQYSEDDECLRKLKEAMTVAMPKVLTEILSCNLIGHSDIESQHTHVSRTNFEQHKDRKLQAALLSLSVTVCNTFVSADQGLVRAIAPADHDASNFAKKLAEMLKRIGDSMDDRREMQELRKLVKQNTNSDDDRLRILELREIVRRKKDSMNDYLEMLKLTSTMVISMMKHRDSYDYEQQDLESLVKSLSTIASEKLLTLDCSMVFASGHHGAMPRNPSRTLGSLVKGAEELLDKIKGPELAVVPASSAEGNLVEIS